MWLGLGLGLELQRVSRRLWMHPWPTLWLCCRLQRPSVRNPQDRLWFSVNYLIGYWLLNYVKKCNRNYLNIIFTECLFQAVGEHVQETLSGRLHLSFFGVSLFPHFNMGAQRELLEEETPIKTSKKSTNKPRKTHLNQAENRNKNQR
jgi:hypothetical protein